MNELIIAAIVGAIAVSLLVAGFVAGRLTERRHAAEVARAMRGIDPYRADDPDAEPEEAL
jgi:NhaP-type Na+/H+ or K+/H+ antiporter